jgi:hypothetical protein
MRGRKVMATPLLPSSICCSTCRVEGLGEEEEEEEDGGEEYE